MRCDERGDDVVELTISGPGRNALGTKVMNECIAKLEAADGRPVLLTGEGLAFSAGLDLKEVAGLDRHRAEEFLNVLDALVLALYTYPGPTVALVNGHAIAGGCVLALACDYRVATADKATRIGLNEVALGLQFPPAILELVRRRISPMHLETVVLGAGLFEPTEALRLGLVDAVREDPREHACAALAALAAHPTDAYAETKKSLRPKLHGRPGEESHFRQHGLSSWVSPELKVRIASLLAKKK